MSVDANGKRIVTRDNKAFSTATSDPCWVPAPGGPVLVPFASRSDSHDLVEADPSVLIEGAPVLTSGAKLARTSGTESGTVGGAASATFCGPALPKSASANVFIGTHQVLREGDYVTHNNDNSEVVPLTLPTAATPTPGPADPEEEVDTVRVTFRRVVELEDVEVIKDGAETAGPANTESVADGFVYLIRGTGADAAVEAVDMNERWHELEDPSAVYHAFYSPFELAADRLEALAADPEALRRRATRLRTRDGGDAWTKREGEGEYLVGLIDHRAVAFHLHTEEEGAIETLARLDENEEGDRTFLMQMAIEAADLASAQQGSERGAYRQLEPAHGFAARRGMGVTGRATNLGRTALDLVREGADTANANRAERRRERLEEMARTRLEVELEERMAEREIAQEEIEAAAAEKFGWMARADYQEMLEDGRGSVDATRETIAFEGLMLLTTGQSELGGAYIAIMAEDPESWLHRLLYDPLPEQKIAGKDEELIDGFWSVALHAVVLAGLEAVDNAHRVLRGDPPPCLPGSKAAELATKGTNKASEELLKHRRERLKRRLGEGTARASAAAREAGAATDAITRVDRIFLVHVQVRVVLHVPGRGADGTIVVYSERSQRLLGLSTTEVSGRARGSASSSSAASTGGSPSGAGDSSFPEMIDIDATARRLRGITHVTNGALAGFAVFNLAKAQKEIETTRDPATFASLGAAYLDLLAAPKPALEALLRRADAVKEAAAARTPVSPTRGGATGGAPAPAASGAGRTALSVGVRAVSILGGAATGLSIFVSAYRVGQAWRTGNYDLMAAEAMVGVGTGTAALSTQAGARAAEAALRWIGGSFVGKKLGFTTMAAKIGVIAGWKFIVAGLLIILVGSYLASRFRRTRLEEWLFYSPWGKSAGSREHRNISEHMDALAHILMTPTVELVLLDGERRPARSAREARYLNVALEYGLYQGEGASYRLSIAFFPRQNPVRTDEHRRLLQRWRAERRAGLHTAWRPLQLFVPKLAELALVEEPASGRVRARLPGVDQVLPAQRSTGAVAYLRTQRRTPTGIDWQIPVRALSFDVRDLEDAMIPHIFHRTVVEIFPQGESLRAARGRPAPTDVRLPDGMIWLEGMDAEDWSPEIEDGEG